jgi:hypothetical protein
MLEITLKQQLASRFREVNGGHPMTPADDAYVTAQFVALDDLCAAHGRDPDETRRLMLAQRLPLPAYLRSDGAEMVPADLFALAEQAGGIDRLQTWFTAHWADPAVGRQEWDSYLSGQYVCLRSVTPASIQRKDYLTAAISAAPNEPDAGSAQWSTRAARADRRTRCTGTRVHPLRPPPLRQPHLTRHLHRRDACTLPVLEPATFTVDRQADDAHVRTRHSLTA